MIVMVSQKPQPKLTWIENTAGLLPCLMMLFLLSTVLVLDAREEHYIFGAEYVSWLNRNDDSVRVAIPAVLLALFAFSALTIGKNWRAFAIFPENVEQRIGRIHFLWPFCLLYISYFGTMLAYGHYVWLHEACNPSSTFGILVSGANCTIDASKLMAALGFSCDQFMRGVWGDFWELVGPPDPTHSVLKDATFILVTGFYRLLAQTALFVIPASLITGVGMLLRRTSSNTTLPMQ